VSRSKVRAHGQDACEQKGRVDRGKLTLPDAATRFDVQEMVEEALITEASGSGPCGQSNQVTQTLSVILARETPEEDATLDDDRNGGQGHADGGDADGSVWVGFISDQPIVGICFVQIVQDRGELQQTEIVVGQQSMGIAARWGSVDHGFGCSRSA
jgi:hypothetical protein